ncbi:MAG: mechanosensitive ion channel family protein [Candidatus Melainabacteria bacterium]
MNLHQLLTEATGLSEPLLSQVIGTVFILAAMTLTRMVAGFILSRRIRDGNKMYMWNRVMEYTITSIGIVLIARLWFAGVQTIVTFFGLLSAALAFALKDPLVNLAAWGFILWRKPFTLGDRIQLSDNKGDVIDIRLFSFSLMEIGNWVDAYQSTGRIIHIPNGKIFTEVLANYNRGFQFVWHELGVTLTYESNWQKARGLLEDIVNEHALHLSRQAEDNIRKASKKMMIFYSTLTPSVYITIEDSGVKLTLRYLCPPKKRRDTAHAINAAILNAFAKADDIDFAYPTRRMYFNPAEGKPEARAAFSLMQAD